MVVFALTACTMFFIGNVQWRRAQLGAQAEVEIASGFVVHVVRVIDADEVAVRGTEGGTFVVRLLGIKGFPPTANEPGLSGLGKAAVTSLELATEGKPIVVTFDEFKTDRSGRVLAYLEADGRDLGELMVQRGHVAAYTLFPFSREELYLGAEAEARTRKAGLWANEKAVARVLGWQDSWKVAREG